MESGRDAAPAGPGRGLDDSGPIIGAVDVEQVLHIGVVEQVSKVAPLLVLVQVVVHTLEVEPRAGPLGAPGLDEKERRVLDHDTQHLVRRAGCHTCREEAARGVIREDRRPVDDVLHEPREVGPDRDSGVLPRVLGRPTVAEAVRREDVVGAR